MICIPSNFQGPWGGWRSVLQSLLRSSCKTRGAGPCCSWVVNIRSMCLRKIFTFTSSHPIHPIPANDGSFSDIVASSSMCNFWSRHPLLKSLIAFQCQSAKPLLVDNIDNKMVTHMYNPNPKHAKDFLQNFCFCQHNKNRNLMLVLPRSTNSLSLLAGQSDSYHSTGSKNNDISFTSNSFILGAINESSVLLLPCQHNQAARLARSAEQRQCS